METTGQSSLRMNALLQVDGSQGEQRLVRDKRFSVKGNGDAPLKRKENQSLGLRHQV